jgi:NADH-quinone oxidoreductase subunit L
VSAAVLLAVLFPLLSGFAGLSLGRNRRVSEALAVIGTLGALVAACAELWLVLRDGSTEEIAFLGSLDLGLVGGSADSGVTLALRGDQLSASVAVAVGLVACCVQIYSTSYMHGEGTPDAPMRYRPFAATVSVFTAAMMIVVHADDLVLLLVGWEIMGVASYLLVGHHSERDSARRAAVKAFLVTRVGDIGVLLAVVVLLVTAGTTSISALTEMAETGELGTGTATAAALLLLAGVAGKSAQFPLHTWLPDAMEGPTPVSALIHAATMVAAGVYLVARVLPIFLEADAALGVAAVIAAITMLGAGLAALAQDDFKRLLAWSTVSQVAFMLAGVVVAAHEEGASPGVFHLLSHAGFKALLFLVAGVVTHLAGSTRLADLGGLRAARPGLAVLLACGLAALAGIPPFSGFWSKEGVLTAAEHAAVEEGSGIAWVVLVSGLITTVITGLYAGRAWAIVAEGQPVPGMGKEHHVSPTMTWPLVVLAVPTVGLGLVLLDPPSSLTVQISPLTAVVGGLLSVAGVAWALSSVRTSTRDVSEALPVGVRSFLRDGYRLDDVQDRLVVRPVIALARVTVIGDRDVVDGYVRATPVLTRWAGIALRRAQTGLATGYAAWLVLGAVAAGVAGVVLS